MALQHLIICALGNNNRVLKVSYSKTDGSKNLAGSAVF